MARRSPFVSLRALALLPLLAGTPACSGEEFSGNETTVVNVAGNYTVTLVNDASTCPQDPEDMNPWMEGNTTTDVQFTIEQDGDRIHGSTMGATAIFFLVKTGANSFAGEIHGSHFSMTNYGTKDVEQEGCTYKLNVTVEGDLDKDTITGSVTYKPDIEQTPECAGYDCEAVQAFNGTRPPSTQ